MEKLVLKKRLRAMAIGAQWLHKLRQPEVQSFEMLRPSFGHLLVHIVTGCAADIADSGVARILVENRHFARCIREYRASYIL